ncbi:MAG: FHA domain-containing protein [Verrucomicrobiales bacterium]|nr:FHA domain-containing protein [Verrucomicrobiales bacterium]
MASIAIYLEDGSHFVQPLDSEVITVGRHPDSSVTLSCASVSGHHGLLKWREGDGWYVQDVGSSNGTRVNGAPIEEARLNDGDRISFGDIQCIFYEGDAPEEAAAPAYVPAPTIAPPEVPPVLHAVAAPGMKRARVPKRLAVYEDSSGGGCMTAILVTALFVVAFIVGLAMRHYQETERNIVNDLIEAATKDMPKIKIEH